MKTLQDFYNEIYQWYLDGCQKHEIFSLSFGLCGNLGIFLDFYDIDEETKTLINASVSKTFRRKSYPFNSNFDDFCNEFELKSFYTNPKRIAFMKKMAGKG